MARIKIDLPDTFHFSTKIPVRITDINYGNHLGNDTILSIIHEARVQYLHHYGYEELNVEGAGLIMNDAAIEFKNEAFYGDIITVSVAASGFSRVSFDFYYKLEKEHQGSSIIIATAKTGMVCFNYNEKKIVSVPEKIKSVLQ